MRCCGCLAAVLVVVAVPTAWGAERPLAAAAAAAAQVQPPAADTFDLRRCLELALENGHRHKAAASGVDVARAEQAQAVSSHYPQVSAGLTYTRLDHDPNFEFPASIIAVPASSFQTSPITITLPANAFGPQLPPVNVPLQVPGTTVQIPAQAMQIPPQTVELMDRNLWTGSLSAVYALYTGGLAGARITQARAGVEVARQEQRRTDLEVVYDVTRAYYGVVLAHQLAVLGRDTLTRMEATLELTEQLFKTGSGRVKRTDYLRNKSMVEAIRAMVADLDSQERTATAGLEAAVEWDHPGGIRVADQELTFTPGDARLEQALSRAYGGSPELARVQAAIAASAAEIDAARAGHLPTVGLFADLHLFGNSYDQGLMTTENKVTWSVGFGVDVPIFQGFRVVNQVRAARAGHDKLVQQLASLRDGIAAQVKSTCYAIEKAQAQQKATHDAYQAATENRELTIRAYQDDLVDTKEVIEAQLTEALLAAQHFKVLYDNLEAQARLALIVGQASSAPSAGRQ